MNPFKKHSLIEVLELISGYSDIEEKSILFNGDFQINGTIEELLEYRNGLKKDSSEHDDLIYGFEAEINIPITSIEVHNYFRKLTNDFQPDEITIVLWEMYVFRDMVLTEMQLKLARIEYLINKWQIPTYTASGKLGTFQVENSKEMIAKIFPLHGLLFYEAIKLLERKLKEKGGNQKVQNRPTTHMAKENSTLVNLITHKKAVDIVDSIKTQFKNIKGKRLKLLLIAMQELNMVPKERVAKRFHNCCQKEFDWDVASYTAMNDYIYNEYSDEKELFEMKETIKTIINQ